MTSTRRTTNSDMDGKQLLLDRVVEALSASDFPEALVERAKALRLIRDELEIRRLRIGIIGITSAGKSTFLNALMGEELLPDQSIPTSNVLTFLRKGERLLSVSFLDGTQKTFKGGELTQKVLLNFTSEEQNPGNKLKLKRVDLTHPGIPFSPELELVDTPGLDAYGHQWHQHVTLEEFVPQADIIIYMTSIRNPFKQSDYNALDRIVEHDQRVLFVMSCKDLERDDEEGGRIVKSRASKLAQHLDRLRHDTAKRKGLHSAGHVLVDSKSALHSRREPELWLASGFADVVSNLNLFEKDLTAIMSESRYRRAARHLEQAIATAEAHLDVLRGNVKKAQENVARLKKLIKDFKDAVEYCVKEIESISIPLNESTLNGVLRNSGLNKDSTRSEFEKLTRDCDAKLHCAYNHLRSGAESIRNNLAQTVEKQGLVALRNPIPETSLADLPKAEAQEKSERICYTKSRGWFDSWKFWPGEEERTKTVYVMQVEQFLTDLRSRNSAGLGRLQHYVETLKGAFTSRYLNLLRGELQKIENELAGLGKEITYGVNENQMLTLIDLLRQPLHEMSQGSYDDNSTTHRHTETKKSSSTSNGTSKVHGKAGFLRYYLSSYRELAFSRRLFNTLGLNSKPSAPLRVAIVGLDSLDRKRVVALLSHQLGEMLNDLESGYFCSLSSKKVNSPQFARQLSVSEGALWDWVSLVVAPDDESTDAWEAHCADLVKWADRILVLVDGPRVGAGLNSLWEAPYWGYVKDSHEKVVYLIPHGAKFDDKISHLFTQVVPQLLEKGPYGQRPVIVHENYDIRYMDFLNLASEVKSGTELRRRWKAKRYSLESPFTEKNLEDMQLD